MSKQTRARVSTPRLLDWDRAGRALRELDPERFARILALAGRAIDAHEGRYVAEPTEADMRPAADLGSEERAQRRRRAFRVLDGGRSQAVDAVRSAIDTGLRDLGGDAA